MLNDLVSHFNRHPRKELDRIVNIFLRSPNQTETSGCNLKDTFHIGSLKFGSFADNGQAFAFGFHQHTHQHDLPKTGSLPQDPDKQAQLALFQGIKE